MNEIRKRLIINILKSRILLIVFFKEKLTKMGLHLEKKRIRKSQDKIHFFLTNFCSNFDVPLKTKGYLKIVFLPSITE